MAMQRPAWTICFFLLWVIILPGAILTHLALVESIPWLEDLPENIGKGLDDTFKFAFFKDDTMKVQEAAKVAVEKCNVNVSICETKNYPNSYTKTTSNTSVERQLIAQKLDSSLMSVNKIAHDKYFGIDELKPTANELETITQEFSQVKDDVMPCQQATPIYCEIYISADLIIEGFADVDKALDKFKNGEIIKTWSDYSSYLVCLHAMPYILIIGLLFFTFFWMRGGVCCCCRGGTKTGFLLLFYVILWLVCFILYFVVCVVGIAIKYASDKFKVSIFEDDPTIEDVLEHIQTKFPEFWKLVFADMEDGLDILLKASFFMVVGSILISIYSCCECCCCPYREKADKAGA
mmetsp:Transcript_19259/g.36042  ORF Transcript_19259/g.36042 Transcript_19259/m.36042 type:complete len:349 (-) Transcript_19259:24-1070(-)